MADNSLKRVSNILFWIGVGIDLITIACLYYLGVIWASGDVESSNICFVFASVFLFMVVLGVIVRLLYQNSRKVLAGVFTIVCVNAIAIPSGIILIVLSKREKEALADHRIQNHENKKKSSLGSESFVPKKMDLFFKKRFENESLLNSSSITDKEFMDAKQKLHEAVLKHQDTINELANSLKMKLDQKMISVNKYEEYLSEINLERARINEFLNTEK